MSSASPDDDYIPEWGDPISPGALRTIASWLDTYDAMARQYLLLVRDLGFITAEELDGALLATQSNEVQDDLRRWANDMETAQR